MTFSPPIPAGLQEPTIRFLRDLQAKLETERSSIDRKIAEVREHIQKLEAEARRANTNRPNGKARRRKGENSRAIAKVFEESSSRAFTKQELADRTGLPFSSVQAVLEKEKANYTQGDDGLWRRSKPDQEGE